MLKITKRQLWEILCLGESVVGEDESDINQDMADKIDKLVQSDKIQEIVIDQYMSENHIGGDDIVSAVDGVLNAISTGYEIISWYGKDAEVLVVGIKPGLLEVVDA